jgi:hypothetical protein
MAGMEAKRDSSALGSHGEVAEETGISSTGDFPAIRTSSWLGQYGETGAPAKDGPPFLV